MKSITIENKINESDEINIKDLCFSNNPNLEEFNFSKGRMIIGNYVFYDSPKLKFFDKCIIDNYEQNK